MNNYADELKEWGRVQVPVEQYFTEEYLAPHRFLGLQAQLQVCCQAGKEAKILEIGPGPGLLTVLLKYLGYKVHTLDFEPKLNPDVNGRLPELPFVSNCVDLVCAFEVLEHMPFDLAMDAFQELCRVARSRIIFSVPNQKELGSMIVSLDLTVLNTYITGFNFRKPLGKLTTPTEHYWEIGFGGITEQDVINLASGSNFVLTDNFLLRPYFHFFIFDLKS
jgi:SAM-dependent methyltransferase